MVEVYVSYLRKKTRRLRAPADPDGPGHRLQHAGPSRPPGAPTGPAGHVPEPRMTLPVAPLCCCWSGIVAAGLVISDVVTYNALRSFLTTRVDQQLDGGGLPGGPGAPLDVGLGPQVPAAPAVGIRSQVPYRLRRASPPPAGSATGAALLSPRAGAPPVRCSSLPGPYGAAAEHLAARSRPTCSSTTAGRRRVRRALLAGLPGFRPAGAGTDLYHRLGHWFRGRWPTGPWPSPLADGGGVIVVAVPLADLESTLRQLLLDRAHRARRAGPRARTRCPQW